MGLCPRLAAYQKEGKQQAWEVGSRVMSQGKRTCSGELGCDGKGQARAGPCSLPWQKDMSRVENHVQQTRLHGVGGRPGSIPVHCLCKWLGLTIETSLFPPA